MALTEFDLKGRSLHTCNSCLQYKIITNDIFYESGMCVDCRDYKKTPINPNLRKKVYLRDFGRLDATGKCPCCYQEISFKNFSACHRLAERLGGQTSLDNLIAGCQSCNIEMGMRHFDEFKEAKQAGLKLPQPRRTYLMEISYSSSALLPDTEMAET